MYVQHSADDNTQRFETRTLRMKVALWRKKCNKYFTKEKKSLKI